MALVAGPLKKALFCGFSYKTMVAYSPNNSFYTGGAMDVIVLNEFLNAVCLFLLLYIMESLSVNRVCHSSCYIRFSVSQQICHIKVKI